MSIVASPVVTHLDVFKFTFRHPHFHDECLTPFAEAVCECEATVPCMKYLICIVIHKLLQTVTHEQDRTLLGLNYCNVFVLPNLHNIILIEFLLS